MIAYSVFILAFGLAVHAVVDTQRTPEKHVRLMSRWGWHLVILSLPFVGAMSWFIAGKPSRTELAHAVRTGRLVTEPLRYDSSRHLAPDDDDVWLRTLTPATPLAKPAAKPAEGEQTS